FGGGRVVAPGPGVLAEVEIDQPFEVAHSVTRAQLVSQAMPADRVVEAPLAQGVYDPALACHRYLARQAPGIFAARGRFGPAADGLLVFPHASVGVAAEGPELARFPLSCLLLDGGQERFDGRQRLG